MQNPPVRLLLVTFTFLLIAAILLTAMAAVEPIRPNSSLFSIQNFAYMVQSDFISNPYDRVIFWMNISDDRSDILGMMAGSSFELIALQKLNQSLDFTLLSASHLTPPQLVTIRNPLLSQLTGMKNVLNRLVELPVQDPLAVQNFSTKLDIVHNLMEQNTPSPEELIAVTQLNLDTIPPEELGPNNPLALPGNLARIIASAFLFRN
ncbi:MAG: hypothetical protein P4L50_27335 [Anaerolineaceae bacterium]|nr:hypothetical protein [Anaerolineaceae bacterium]